MHNPSPLAFAPSQLWLGNDGNWSSFDVRIGSPEQNFHVLPSAALGDLLVPHEAGCSPDDGVPANCADLRGVFGSNFEQGFVPNASNSWHTLDFFDPRLESSLGYTDSAMYGTDTVGLMIQDSGGPTLQDQVVGAVRTMPFFVGFFGLSPKASNFTNYDQPRRSYLTTLRDTGIIPSLSYAYSAGAYYKSPKVLGSLTLGGYDKDRFEPNNFTFPFDPDDSKPTSLKLQQITVEHTSNGSAVILQEETYVNLDFTLPYLWLPGSVCDHIATVFKLQYDNSTELYLVSDDTHAELMTQDPVFTFAFGESLSVKDTVSIKLPYAAFDLQASWPIYNSTKNYFPIRRASNATQLTLGRAFMQEAYMIVDFERGNFSLHQAAFPPSNAQRIVSIPGKDSDPFHKESKLSKGSIAGIVTGSVIFVALLVVLATLLVRRRTHRPRAESLPRSNQSSSSEKGEISELPEVGNKREQLMSSEVLELQWSREEELDGKAMCELDSGHPVCAIAFAEPRKASEQ